jgi:hypothetical protein
MNDENENLWSFSWQTIPSGVEAISSKVVASDKPCRSKLPLPGYNLVAPVSRMLAVVNRGMLSRDGAVCSSS